MSKRRKTIPARFIKDACNENCKLKCKDKIDDEGRYHLFSSFWDLGNLVAQRAYLRTCMEDITPKYKYTNSQNPRRPNKAFYFILNDNKIRVCKTFFKNTLSISERMIFTVQSRMNDGFMLDDLRGRHNNHNKLNPQLLDDIRKHINTIPKLESHYVRASTSKQYIGGDKTIKDLYNDFAAQQSNSNREVGNYMAYYKIFNTEFTLTELLNGDKKAYDNVHCFFWTEVDVKRGANEIGSCIFGNIYKICVQKMKNRNKLYFTQTTAVGRIKINISPHYICMP